jgi:hypothetical protein
VSVHGLPVSGGDNDAVMRKGVCIAGFRLTNDSTYSAYFFYFGSGVAVGLLISLAVDRSIEP